MQYLYDEVASLDRRCYDEFFLSEDILMEHAADGMADFIRRKFPKNSKVIIAVGSGNNGADGIALARLLHREYDTSLLYVKEPKSTMAKLQEKRAEAIGVKTCTKLECDILVDAIVGTGFSGEFNSELTHILKSLNELDAYKIACDVPSGLKASGVCADNSFIADTTLTMGALKKSMFSDEAKEFVGEIELLNLGLSRLIYEKGSNAVLLDMEDLKLPHRQKKNSHKGTYGHLCLFSGEKIGASVLSAQAALRFGTGLVTLLGYENEHILNIPYEIMYAHEIPKNTTAIALGMGLGDEFSDEEIEKLAQSEIPLLLDADIFYKKSFLKLLEKKELLLTPHPKEFTQILKATAVADITVEELQKERFKYVELFCRAYPDTVLLLKGANVLIAQKNKLYVNPHGSAKLAKGGSGDVLAGLISSLLAQGVQPLEAAINGSLAHTKLAQNYSGADFSLTPNDLINGIGNL